MSRVDEEQLQQAQRNEVDVEKRGDEKGSLTHHLWIWLSLVYATVLFPVWMRLASWLARKMTVGNKRNRKKIKITDSKRHQKTNKSGKQDTQRLKLVCEMGSTNKVGNRWTYRQKRMSLWLRSDTKITRQEQMWTHGISEEETQEVGLFEQWKKKWKSQTNPLKWRTSNFELTELMKFHNLVSTIYQQCHLVKVTIHWFCHGP